MNLKINEDNIIIKISGEGPQGSQGPQGEQGPQGPQGAQGPQGPQGIVENIADTASGSIATFTDGADGLPVKDLTAAIEPVQQDLHGYDNPWPAGGGKNLLNKDDAEIGTEWNGASNSARARLAIPVKPSTTYTLSMNGTNNLEAIYQKTTDVVPASSGGPEITSFPVTITTETNSNYIVLAFSKTDISQSDIDALKLQLELGSSATSYAPYSNICPIPGWTGCNITRTGKNLFGSAEPGAIIGNGEEGYRMSASVTKGTHFTGKIEQGKTYTIKAYYSTGMDKFRIVLFRDYPDATPQFTVRTLVNNSNPSEDSTYTFTNDGYNWAVLGVCSSTANHLSTAQAQLEEGSSATAYEAPGTPVAIPFGQTIYGGTLDVTTGVLTATHAKIVLDGVSAGYKVIAKGAGDNNNNFYWNLDSASTLGKNPSSQVTKDELIASGYKWNNLKLLEDHNRNNQGASGFIGSAGYFQPRICFPISSEIDTAEKCNQWLNNLYTNGTPAEFIYKLATPVTYQLTPTQVTTLLGGNNIFADTGAVSVTYRADTKLYVDRKIAEANAATRSMIAAVTDTMVAPANLVINDLIIVGENLYKVTANVQSGGTLTVGTNVAAVTLAEYILSMTA